MSSSNDVFLDLGSGEEKAIQIFIFLLSCICTDFVCPTELLCMVAHVCSMGAVRNQLNHSSSMCSASVTEW